MPARNASRPAFPHLLNHPQTVRFAPRHEHVDDDLGYAPHHHHNTWLPAQSAAGSDDWYEMPPAIIRPESPDSADHVHPHQHQQTYSPPMYPLHAAYNQQPAARGYNHHANYYPVPVPVPVWPQPVLPVYEHHHHHHHHGLSPTSPTSDAAPSRRPAETPEDRKRALQARLCSFLQPYKRPYSSKVSAGSLLTVSSSPMQYDYTRYRRRDLDEIAIDSSVSRLKLIHEDLPWDVVIRSRDANGITVRDVLDGVYTELNKPVSEEEARSKRGHWLVIRHRENLGGIPEGSDAYDDLRRMDWMRCPQGIVRFTGLRASDEDSTFYMVFEK